MHAKNRQNQNKAFCEKKSGCDNQTHWLFFFIKQIEFMKADFNSL